MHWKSINLVRDLICLVVNSSIFSMPFSQLFYDGYQNLAVNLATTVKAHPACSPSDRLMKVVQLGLREEEGLSIKTKTPM